MKILILGYGYAAPFEKIGEVTEVYTCEEVDVEGFDLVVFTGGEDVTPSFYGEEPHPSTGNYLLRDVMEREIFQDCVFYEIPMAGICRGSQFLTVMSGGKLVQDIDGHAIGGTHPVDTSESKVVEVTSTHHQMMYPYLMDKGSFELLAFSAVHGTARGMPDGIEKLTHVVEAVYYPETQCLCVQFHPEYMPEDSDGFQYYQSLLQDYIVNRKVA